MAVVNDGKLGGSAKFIALVGLLLLHSLVSVLAQNRLNGGTRHCLWEVRAKTNVAYLFGSIL